MQQQLDLSATETQNMLQFTKLIAREAGSMIHKVFRQPPTDYARKSATDPVTETDKAVEAYLFNSIRSRYPTHAFIGEESAAEVEWTDKPTWIIDPIDGTANFIHRIPVCAVSIALTVNKQYIIGVIYNPIQDELFEATHLTQSQLNGVPISVSTVSSLQSACVATECGSDRTDVKLDWMLHNLSAVLRNSAQCVRMMGSCALNMAYVACGRFDVLYERGPFAWDMAAGVLIVRQAGGMVKGGVSPATEFDLTGRHLLAFTPSLSGEIGAVFDTSV